MARVYKISTSRTDNVTALQNAMQFVSGVFKWAVRDFSIAEIAVDIINYSGSKVHATCPNWYNFKQPQPRLLNTAICPTSSQLHPFLTLPLSVFSDQLLYPSVIRALRMHIGKN